MNIDDLALGYVLETLDEQEVVRTRDLLDRNDAAFAQAVERARRDVMELRKGMTLVAEHANPTAEVERGPRAARSWTYRLAGAAAAVVLLAAGASVVLRGDDPVTPRDDVGGQEGVVNSGAAGMMIEFPGLEAMVRDAQQVVVGTVIDVRTERSESLGSFTLATLKVDETLKGPQAGQMVAFDYDMAGDTLVTGEEGAEASWTAVGRQMLLFLIPDVGTDSAAIEPPHHQVLHGAYGRYLIEGGALQDAPFTLEQVRAATN